MFFLDTLRMQEYLEYRTVFGPVSDGVRHLEPEYSTWKECRGSIEYGKIITTMVDNKPKSAVTIDLYATVSLSERDEVRNRDDPDMVYIIQSVLSPPNRLSILYKYAVIRA